MIDDIPRPSISPRELHSPKSLEEVEQFLDGIIEDYCRDLATRLLDPDRDEPLDVDDVDELLAGQRECFEIWRANILAVVTTLPKNHVTGVSYE